ncbi:hypothetical protein [Mesorhizobium sp. BR1-1-4]|uniref:hypothetical protein n=1 Tax=Mesorhizobium sp. BR1-1-4 TaxID=2876650 RepID=UPI001CCCFEC5|nr:hypothetical protein [Mesorhizobium sp. BR1-1-4]MBZ9925017.1 hypothetical protein [Mesorhizobium sp. BR1-1-4]
MPILPLVPHVSRYRGGKRDLQLKNAQANALAQRVAEHVNKLIADDPRELQQYFFANIARDLGVSVEVVRGAISDGGHNGITIRIDAEDRIALARYRHG